MPNSEQYNIIIIEPSPVIQEGLKVLLERYQGFRVEHCFSSFELFESAHIRSSFQIILINPADIQFDKQFSTKKILLKYPDVLIIALHYNCINIELIHSFDGVVDIYSTGDLLIKKILKIIEQTDHSRSKQNTESVDLSDREKEILISVAIGLTNKEIADKLNISTHTVISHRKNISRKIGIKTVSGLTIYAIYNNLISEDDI